jgi:CHAT domain-containing protein
MRLRDADRAYDAHDPGKSKQPQRAAALWQRREQADRDLRDIETEVRKSAPQYAALSNPRPCSLAEARSALASNEVALIYLPGSPRSHVVLVEARPKRIDPAEGLAIYELPRESEINDLVAALTDVETLARPANVLALAAEAHDMLLKPLAGRIRGKDLVIVPGGDLSYLPFELLREPTDEGDRRYLIESRRVRYAPSLTTLHLIGQWKKSRRQPDRALWALGDPIYDGKDSRYRGKGGTRPGGPYTRLTHTAEEVRQIGKILKAPAESLYLGERASEANIRKASESGELGRARYVHLATHGDLGVGMGRQPGLVLGLVAGRREPGGEEGYLDMEEVLTLRLNADLVVLSACRSVEGRLYNGEGVRGLARAFLCAGSKGVVCSLWNVEDRATADLMGDFYRLLADGKSAADALRAAKRSRIDKGQAALHWAGFVLIGE